MNNPIYSMVKLDTDAIMASVDLSALAGKSVLVTGASGLLGTYFMACLGESVRRGDGPASVNAILHSTPQPELLQFSNFAGAEILQLDLADSRSLRDLGCYDYVIHAAGYGQPGRFMEDQLKTIRLNTNATLSLFNHLSSDGHFLFLSTSEVYSGLSNPPFNEEQIGSTNTTHPRACYIEAKRCGEAICNIQREKGVHASAARLALAYGPGTKPGDRRVINAFIERGIRTQKVSLQDMGSAKRTYCYVADAVEILWNILLYGTQSIYNVGGESRTTVAELATLIASILQVPAVFPQHSAELAGAPDDVHLDMTRVRQEFGKHHYVSLQEGLERTVAWQQALYANTSN
jgi:nucleoside-diphosphate-sugar epimerase